MVKVQLPGGFCDVSVLLTVGTVNVGACSEGSVTLPTVILTQNVFSMPMATGLFATSRSSKKPV